MFGRISSIVATSGPGRANPLSVRLYILHSCPKRAVEGSHCILVGQLQRLFAYASHVRRGTGDIALHNTGSPPLSFAFGLLKYTRHYPISLG